MEFFFGGGHSYSSPKKHKVLIFVSKWVVINYEKYVVCWSFVMRIYFIILVSFIIYLEQLTYVPPCWWSWILGREQDILQIFFAIQFVSIRYYCKYKFNYFY